MFSRKLLTVLALATCATTWATPSHIANAARFLMKHARNVSLGEEMRQLEREGFEPAYIRPVGHHFWAGGVRFRGPFDLTVAVTNDDAIFPQDAGLHWEPVSGWEWNQRDKRSTVKQAKAEFARVQRVARVREMDVTIYRGNYEDYSSKTDCIAYAKYLIADLTKVWGKPFKVEYDFDQPQLPESGVFVQWNNKWHSWLQVCPDRTWGATLGVEIPSKKSGLRRRVSAGSG